jgi:hypothetical protein
VVRRPLLALIARRIGVPKLLDGRDDAIHF